MKVPRGHGLGCIPAYPYDDVHPSAEGHRVLFEQVVAAHLDDAVAPP